MKYILCAALLVSYMACASGYLRGSVVALSLPGGYEDAPLSPHIFLKEPTGLLHSPEMYNLHEIRHEPFSMPSLTGSTGPRTGTRKRKRTYGQGLPTGIILCQEPSKKHKKS